jgi:hypothetical protein
VARGAAGAGYVHNDDLGDAEAVYGPNFSGGRRAAREEPLPIGEERSRRL